MSDRETALCGSRDHRVYDRYTEVRTGIRFTSSACDHAIRTHSNGDIAGRTSGAEEQNIVAVLRRTITTSN